MEKPYASWVKQLDDFDQAIGGLPMLERSVRMWGAFAPAVPALFDAVMIESQAYKAQAAQLRGWMTANETGEGDPLVFGRELRGTIHASRRLKGVIDAFNREKAIAELAYPELAGGSIKDTGVIAVGMHVEPERDAGADPLKAPLERRDAVKVAPPDPTPPASRRERVA